MFRRTILGLALALSAAIPARAATISITSDKIAYQTGEQILLTVTGDAEGAAGYGVYGRLVYAGSMTNTLGSTQEALSSGAQTWMTGDLAFSGAPSPAPEPSSALLFGLGLVVARVAVRRRTGR